MHQVRAGRAPKRSGDLVQRGRKKKALRGFVHQVRAGGVGAPLPAKPCACVARRQHFALARSRSPAELAPRCRQSLMPPLRGANILPWSAAGHRPSWRLGAGKALCLRYGAPTFYPENRPGIAHVGAPLPAKPCISVAGRQHFTLRLGRSPTELAPQCRQSHVYPLRRRQHFALRRLCPSAKLAPHCRQSLVPPLRGANICPGAQPATGRVGAPLPAKPCASVARRQHFTLRLGRTPAELAPHCRQSLVPPLRGANILPWSAAGHRPLAPQCRQNLMPPLRGANILPWSAARTPAELAPHCRQSLVPPLRGANIFALERCRSPAELAPRCRQSLVPPLRGANILP